MRGRCVQLTCRKLYSFGTILCWFVTAFVLTSRLKDFTSIRSYNEYSEVPSLRLIPYLSDRLKSNQTTYISIVNKDVHIYSALARKSYNASFYDVIVLNGWEFSPLRQTSFNCCLYYDHDNIQSAPLLDKLHWNFLGRAKLETKQFLCPNPSYANNTLPLAVSLTQTNCSGDQSLYVPVESPLKVAHSKDTLAVCTKLAYGNVSASEMIEWFEAQKLLGVSKVITYTHKLNTDAMRVLRHYESEELEAHYPFDLPDTERFRRSVGVKNFQSWNDEQVVVLDCHARLMGYTYIGLYDMDEFVIPKKMPTLLELLKFLRNLAPRAAGFIFKTEIYATTWGRMDTSHQTDLTIGQYFNRTMAFRDRPKSIIITDRVIPGRLSTHGFWPIRGSSYTKPLVPESFATLKHYRSCRKEWLKKGGEKCYRNITRVMDMSMQTWAQKIENNVKRVKKEIFSSDHG